MVSRCRIAAAACWGTGVLDPTRRPAEDQFVLVQVHDEAPVVKQLIVEGSRQFLRTPNPELPNPVMEMSAQDRILGVVVFKGEIP